MGKAGKLTMSSLIVFTIVGFLITYLGFWLYTDNFGLITHSEIERLSSEAKVLDDGSLFVSETWHYDTGRINGINVNFGYSKAKGETVQIEGVYVGEQKSELVRSANKGNSGVYTYKDRGEQQQLKIYEKTSGKTAFRVDYRVAGFVKQYRDVQDVYWKIFSKSDRSVPLQLNATLKFPASVQSETIKLFAHGDVAEGSQITLEDGNVVKVDVGGLYDNTFVEVRALLPENPLPHVSNRSDEPRFAAFLADETNDVAETKEKIVANKGHKEIIRTFFSGIAMFWFIVTIYLFIVFRQFYKKYDAEKYESSLTYYRQTPSFSPSVAALVLDPDKPTGQAQLIATIFSLYTKRVLTFTDLKRDVQIKLLKNNLDLADEALTNDESVVYNWLQESFGKSNEGTYKEFFNIGKRTTRAARQFEERFIDFEQAVQQAYRKLQFESYNGLDDAMPKSMFGFMFIFIIMLIVVGMLRLSNDSYELLLWVTGGLTLIFAIDFGMLRYYKDNAYQLTEEGTRRRAEVKGLKTYLNDYSLLKDAEPQAIHLWEKYFVYGLALGVSKKALNKLYQHIPQTVDASFDLHTIYMMHYLSYHYNIVHRSQNAVSAMAQYTGRSATSRSGGFGGFSGGGGSGSGGSSSGSF